MGKCLTGVQKFWGLACILWLVSFLVAGQNNFSRSAGSAIIFLVIGGFPMILFCIFVATSKILDSQSHRSREVEPLQIITPAISEREIAPEPRESPHTNAAYYLNIDSPVTYVYQKDGRVEGNDCAVCLGYLQQGEMVAMLKSCSHLYHEKCINPWLQLHKTCPICRSRVDEKAAEESAV